jgi:hypothetical protein
VRRCVVMAKHHGRSTAQKEIGFESVLQTSTQRLTDSDMFFIGPP